MRVYLDSSALVKRIFGERESAALEEALAELVSNQAHLVAWALAWVEVGRAVRRHDAAPSAGRALEAALAGLVQRPMTDDVVSLARHLAPGDLRTLDAIHLATAVLLAVDVVITYDERLARACRYNGFEVLAPGR